MKLTSLTLGGFKGINTTATIPLAPITLLFGANSTGKSSILHGMLYLYEILVNQNIDAEYSELTGQKVWLGGFRNMVFGKGTRGVITIGAKLDLSDTEEVLDDYVSSAETHFLETTIDCYPDAGANVWSFKLEITWDNYIKRPFIRLFECFGSDELFCRFEKKAGSPGSYITYYKPLGTWQIPDEIGVLADLITPESWQDIGLSDQKQALPDIDKRIELSDTLLDAGLQEEEFHHAIRTFAEASLSQATLAPLKLLRKKLKTLLHVGPLRVVPDQKFHIANRMESGRWYDGSGAWDLFAQRNEDLMEGVNNWFGCVSGWKYGFATHVDPVSGHRQVYVGQTVSVSENLIAQEVRHHLCELGVGISQVFPFIAGALYKKAEMFSFEQPELHIHPKWQLELADIMLEAINQQPDKFFLVETHSEHLMLRLLRRRRETADDELENAAFPCRPEDIQIIFCEKESDETTLIPIATTDEGEFDVSWPNGFFAERREELF